MIFHVFEVQTVSTFEMSLRILYFEYSELQDISTYCEFLFDMDDIFEVQPESILKMSSRMPSLQQIPQSHNPTIAFIFKELATLTRDITF